MPMHPRNSFFFVLVIFVTFSSIFLCFSFIFVFVFLLQNTAVSIILNDGKSRLQKYITRRVTKWKTNFNREKTISINGITERYG